MAGTPVIANNLDLPLSSSDEDALESSPSTLLSLPSSNVNMVHPLLNLQVMVQPLPAALINNFIQVHNNNHNIRN